MLRDIIEDARRARAAWALLAVLDAEPGMWVLEISTGTGYNAALLAHRLGTHNVTSIEIDPVLADHARRALTATGYHTSVAPTAWPVTTTSP